MTSYVNQRGAVHILFLVVVLVLALAFAGLWFVQLQENEKLQADTRRAKQALTASEEQAYWGKEVYDEIAGLIGSEVPAKAVYDPTDPTKTAADYVRRGKAAVTSLLNSVGPRVDDPSIREKDLSTLVEKLVGAYARMKADRDTKDTIAKAKQTEIDALQAQLRQAETTHSSERTRIQETADNDKRTLSAQIDTLTKETQSSSARVRDLTDRGIKDRDEFNNDVQNLTREKTELDGQVRTVQAEKRVARATQVPDGKLIAVDGNRSKAFLDIGSKDLLRRDMRFQVLGVGKGNERVHKGYITVTDIMGDMAEAFMDEVVPGQRMEAGDLVYSPIFDRPTDDPTRKVRFVFLGELPGRYPREVAERIIARKGATVDTEVSVRTDFLVLGERESEDEEPLTDTEQYRTALRWGVEILRARDLAPFLK
ncbi:MAG TPA: hypothetical protein PKA37_02435 [Planctomycetota bacterium]|jgi:hypothetical protein|nr:hypothetical protein [Planctomycetota bacterium]